MSYRRRHESPGLEVEGSTAGASGAGDLARVRLIAHLDCGHDLEYFDKIEEKYPFWCPECEESPEGKYPWWIEAQVIER